MSSNNTYFSLTTLKASPVAEGTAFLVQDLVVASGTFFWTLGNFTGRADNENIIESDNAPLSTGAWLRQAASNIGAPEGTTQDSLDRRARVASIVTLAGDGATNDAAALQAIVDAAAASDQPVNLTGGLRIRINSTINLPSGLVVTGDGSCSIELGANVTALRTVPGGSHISLSGFAIDGKRGTYTSTANDGISIDWTTVAGAGISIREVSIKDIGGVAIKALASAATPSAEVSIQNSRVENSGAHGIVVQGGISRVRIIGNEVRYTGLSFADRPGITASRGGSDVTVSNNLVIGSPAALGTSVHGISIDSSSEVVCTGNQIRDWKGIGLEVGFVSGGSFTGNVVSNCNYGIALSGTEPLNGRNIDIVISGNMIFDVKGPGIHSFITGATGAYLHKNVFIASNNVARSSGGSGIGIYMRHVDGLSLFGNSSCDNELSGVFLDDCPNHALGDIQILRNNLEGGLKPVSGITAAATTATASVAAHGWSNGDLIGVWGASPTEFNQNLPISNVAANTFDYALPRSGLGVAAGGKVAGKAKSNAHGGLRINWSLFGVNDRGFNRMGRITAAYNGFRDFYDVNLNGVTGFVNDKIFIKDSASNPRPENLTSGISSNVKDALAIEMKNGKFVIAFNISGTLTYLSIPLDGSTTAWTQGVTVP